MGDVDVAGEIYGYLGIAEEAWKGLKVDFKDIEGIGEILIHT